MTSRQAAEQVLDHLWAPPSPGAPRTEVYAILDAARSPRIHPWIQRRTLDRACLFAGKLEPELAAAAPYLVHLYRREPFTRELVETAWGDAWGIFVVSPASLEELRVHFRRFLRVKDEQGRRLLFRYYDPRVLRTYLPTCNEHELATVFGPVQRLCAESEDGGALLHYRRAHPGLAVDTSPIPAAEQSVAAL